MSGFASSLDTDVRDSLPNNYRAGGDAETARLWRAGRPLPAAPHHGIKFFCPHFSALITPPPLEIFLPQIFLPALPVSAFRRRQRKQTRVPPL